MKKTTMLLTTGAMLLWPCAGAWAQEPAATQPAAADELVVIGIRASLQQAIEVKRDAVQVMDVITAEDVGKLPDANVAEALQRVTGVQITRVFGEGQAVNVRGLQQVRVEVDGRTLLGWSARLSPPENEQLGRSSGLDAVPSGLFGRLEVRKSPVASDTEGGLSGTVNLVTPRPLSLKPTLSLRASGTYSEVSDAVEPAITGLWSHRFFDDRLGILIAGEHQERTSTIQAFERNNFLNRTYTQVGGPSTTLQTPVLLQYENFTVDRTRTGYNAVLQFEVTPDLTLTADALFSELTTGRRQDFLSWRLPTGSNPVTNAVLAGTYVLAGAASGTLQTAGQIRNEPTQSELFGFNAAFNRGKLSIDADIYSSKGTLDQTIQIITLQGVAAVPGAFDFRAGRIPSLTLGTATAPFDATNFANYNPASNGVRSNRLIGLLEETTTKIDLGYAFHDAFEVSAGLRQTDLQAKSNAFRSQTTRPRAEIQPFTGLTGADFLSEISGIFPRPFLTTAPTFGYVFNTAQAAQPNPNPGAASALLPNAQRDYDLDETTIAAYLMVAGKSQIGAMPISYNAGFRWIDTDLTVDTFRNIGAASTLVTDRSEYSKVLPSANLTVTITPNMLVRLGASQTMQRASIADLAPSEFFNATNLSVTGGNAALEPPVATQGDLSFEYYFGASSLFSGAVFVKSVDNFIATFVTQGTDLDLDPAGRVLTFSRPENLASADVRGFEIGVQHFLDFLPAPFDGLGFIANYTFADSEDNNGFPLVAVSEHSTNLVALYEKGPVSGRLAYNWRDEALFEFSEGRPSFIGARSQLDAQLGFDVTDAIQVSFQALNLIPEDSATVEYSGSNETALNSYALSERRFTFGVRAKF